MLIIPTLPVPSQTISVLLSGQPSRINIFQRTAETLTDADPIVGFLGTNESDFVVTDEEDYMQISEVSGFGAISIPAMFIELYVNDQPIITGVLCQSFNRIVRDSYLGFLGDLAFQDLSGDADPYYTGLGTRWRLIYLEPSEL